MVGGHSRVAWWCRCSDCLQSVVGPSAFLDLGCGMDCRKTLFRRRHFQVSGVDLNPSSSNSHTRILSFNCTFDSSWHYSGPCSDVPHLDYSKNYWTELNWTVYSSSLRAYCAKCKSGFKTKTSQKVKALWNSTIAKPDFHGDKKTFCHPYEFISQILTIAHLFCICFVSFHAQNFFAVHVLPTSDWELAYVATGHGRESSKLDWRYPEQTTSENNDPCET